MCEVKKNVDVKVIKEHLVSIASQIAESQEPVNATLVKDENYSSMTAMVGNQVLCINFMH